MVKTVNVILDILTSNYTYKMDFLKFWIDMVSGGGGVLLHTHAHTHIHTNPLLKLASQVQDKSSLSY